MNVTPLLSIITTSFNRQGLLRKALDSVLSQDYPAVEQIVVDGGSTDGTPELLREYEKKFQERGYAFRWVSEKDSGQAGAMNKGLKMATGEFVMIFNSDDVLLENSARPFMEKLAADPAVDLIYGNHDVFWKDGRRELRVHHQYSLEDMVQGGHQIPQTAAIFRRSLAIKAGGFDKSLHYVAEHEFFMRFVRAGGKILYFPRRLQAVLQHEAQKTTTGPKIAYRETKEVHFRHGARYFSRFHLLSIKDRYLGWLFGSLRRRAPSVYQAMKSVFNKLA